MNVQATPKKKPSMLKRMLIMIGLVLLLVAILAGAKFLQIRKLIANQPKPSPQVVSAVTVGKLQWRPELQAVGTMVAVRGVDVTAEVAGLVRSVHFKSGDEVKGGQLLIQMNADADVAQLRSLEAQAALSETVLERDKKQLAVRGIAQAQVDADTADLAAKRALAAQQAALVAKKTINAPFTGKLGIASVNPGQYINPGDKIIALQALDPIYVDFSLPQQQLATLAIGQPVKLAIDAFPGQAFEGKINAISPKVDASTRNLLIEATVANPKRLLLPGMFANVGVDVGDQMDHLTLPQTAITYNPYGSTVFVLKPGDKKDEKGNAPLVAHQVFVTPGPTRGDQVAILKGLEAGQQVVTSGQLKLKNGSQVVVDNSLQPADSANPKPQEQ